MLGIIDINIIWLTVIISALYIYIKYYLYNYWSRHGIPHEEASLPLGNIPLAYCFGQLSLGDLMKNSYRKFRNNRFFGFYVLFRPVVVINDPELIREILVKEFPRFADRGWYSAVKNDPMSNNLFLLPEDRWRKLKSKFSPIFTPGKIKQMFPLIQEISDNMVEALDTELEKSDVLEIRDLISRYTIDVISSLVYGFNCGSLKGSDNEFQYYGNKTFQPGRLRNLLAIFLPEILKRTTLPYFEKEIGDFFVNTLKNTIDYRRKEKIMRKDLMNILIQLIENSEEQNGKSLDGDLNKENTDGLSMADAAAQTLILFIAGYQTSSITAAYCLLELAMQSDIQDKLRLEIDEIANSPEGFTFDNVMGMEYLDMVLSETLRKYPTLAHLTRMCAEDFHIPDSNYTIPKGMRVLISVSGLHYDPEYFPNPQKFDPSRFTKENLATRSKYVHIPFGEGPRTCIGKRFGIVQTKQALVTLLHSYKFYISDKTVLPIRFSPDNIVQLSKYGVRLRVEKRIK